MADLGQITPEAGSRFSRAISDLTAPRHSGLRALGRTLLAIAATVGIVAAIIGALGVNPASAFESLVRGSVGNTFSFGQTVMIASILALTGLAAAIPFSARLWNIGGEGQLYFGAFVAAAVGITFPQSLPAWLFVTVVVVFATLGGAVWGFVPGVLKATLNANEVIVSLMTVFIAILLANWAITEGWPRGSSQTEYVADNSLLPNIWSATTITAGAPLAVGAVLVAWLLMSRTPLGFEIRAIGLNANAALLNCMSVKRVTILVFVIGGAFAGMAGSIAVLGISGTLVTGFSGNFGFLGIAVALLARLSPLWIIPSAFFFAMLRVGANGLQVTTGLSSSVGEVLVATFIVLLLAFHVIRLRYAEAAQ